MKVPNNSAITEKTFIEKNIIGKNNAKKHYLEKGPPLTDLTMDHRFSINGYNIADDGHRPKMKVAEEIFAQKANWLQ